MCSKSCSFFAILFNLSVTLELYIIFEASNMSDKHFVDDSNDVITFWAHSFSIRYVLYFCPYEPV